MRIKKCILPLILAFSFVFTSCGTTPKNHADKKGTANYNTYSTSPGSICYTDDAIFVFDNYEHRLSFYPPDLASPLAPLCSRPNCEHTDSSCSSVVDALGIYAWNNHLYYIDATGSKFALYQMDSDGQNRTKLCTLNIDRENEIYYIYQIANGHMVFHMYEGDHDKPLVTSYLYSLEHPKEPPVVLNCSDWTDDQFIITIPFIFEDRIFFNLSNRNTGSLNVYDIASGQTEQLLEDWHPLDALSYDGDTLYFFDQSEGSLNSINLDSKEITQYCNDLPVDRIPYGSYDDTYFYLNATDIETVPADELDVIVYDLLGNEVQRLSIAESDLDVLPVFEVSTEDYIFFKSMMPTDGSYIDRPICYIEKEALADGNAKFIPLT